MKIKNLLSAIAILCTSLSVFSIGNSDHNETDDKDTTDIKEVIQGCSTNGGLHLALATGDFWCEPDKPDPFPCGGYYLGFPDLNNNPPNNFVPPTSVAKPNLNQIKSNTIKTIDAKNNLNSFLSGSACGVEANIRPGGDYIKPTTDENTSVFIVKEDISEPNCMTELHTVNVKDIKGSNVIDFSFIHIINKCPPPPPPPAPGDPSPTNGDPSGCFNDSLCTFCYCNAYFCESWGEFYDTYDSHPTNIGAYGSNH